MVVRPCQYREKDGTYRKKGIDTMTWTWNQNLSLFSLFYLTLAQPRSYFEVSRTSCLVKLPIQSDINLNHQSCNSLSQISYITISWLLTVFPDWVLASIPPVGGGKEGSWSVWSKCSGSDGKKPESACARHLPTKVISWYKELKNRKQNIHGDVEILNKKTSKKTHFSDVLDLSSQNTAS